jgi:hypothetical protein
MHNESNLSRRAFLARTSAFGLAGLVAAPTAAPDVHAAPSAAPGRLDLTRATCADFAACMGTTFQIYPTRGKPVEVKLIRAREMRRVASVRAGTRNPFRLVFRGAAGAALPQETYRVEHTGLGGMALFIVPTGLRGETPTYVAHFG